MTDPRIDLKSPFVAAILAYLIPGAGHFYQGRTFKGLIYSVCILGTFLGGMALGDWQPVYYRRDPVNTHYGYMSQVMVGLPALPALIQKRRLEHDRGHVNMIDARMEVPFEGRLHESSADGSLTEEFLSGTVVLEPTEGRMGLEVGGVFRGTRDGQPLELKLGGPFEMGPEISPSPQRRVIIGVLSGDDQRIPSARLDGYIPRKFVNWCEVPLDDDNLDRLHGSLGKRFDLAEVYTWIAGLLNVLAIWDAFDGPAYGFGDERDREEEDEKTKLKKPQPA